MGKTTVFHIKTTPPKGRNTWDADTGAKIQANLFAMVAMLVADNEDAETKLMQMIADAKSGAAAFPLAV